MNYFQISLGQFEKNLSHPQKLACSYTYVLHHHIFRDFLVLF